MSQSEAWKKAHGRPPYDKPAPKKGGAKKADDDTGNEGGTGES